MRGELSKEAHAISDTGMAYFFAPMPLDRETLPKFMGFHELLVDVVTSGIAHCAYAQCVQAL